MGHGGAHPKPAGYGQAAGRDRARGRHRQRQRRAPNNGGHRRRGAEQDGVPESGGERGVPAPPNGAAPPPARVHGRGGRAGRQVRDPGDDRAAGERVGDREGPRGVGRAGGVPAGAVPAGGRRRGQGGGLERDGLPAPPVRRGAEDLPRHQLRAGSTGAGARQPPAPLRLGAPQRHAPRGPGHGRGAGALDAAAGAPCPRPQVEAACLGMHDCSLR